MDYWRREQVGAATGIVAVALFIVGALLPGQFPGPQATGQQIATFFAENRTAILWQTFLLGGAVIFGLWFLGSLRALLRRAEGGAGRIAGVAYAGGLLMILTTLISDLFTVVVAYRPVGEFTPELTRAFYSLTAITNTLGTFPMVVLAGAVTLVLLRTEILPKFVAWVGAAAIAGAGIGTITLFYNSGTLAVGGNVAFFVPMFSMSALFAVASATMIPRLGQPHGITHMQRRVSDVWSDEERARRTAQQ
jgi:hypothetical protein